MNYDHVKGQLVNLKNSDVQKQISQLAQEAGMTPGEYLSQVLSNRNERKIKELVDTEGVSPEFARRMVDNEDALARYRAEEESQAGQKQWEGMVKLFLQEYPDVKATDIPPEVWERAAKTNDLIGAYALHETKLLKTQLAEAQNALGQKKQNEANKQTAVGSVRGSKSAATEDAFLDGLFGR
jgi:hypothetical protein